MTRKKICVCIPCYNEEDNVIPLTEDLIRLFEDELPQYDYLIQFIDNCSEDSTRKNLESLCLQSTHVRAIFNARNFKGNSAIYGLLNSEGDCAIYLSADFQDPIDAIPQMLEKWEEGHQVVAGVKKGAKENIIKKNARSLYYKLMKKYSGLDFIEQFCNFGVYDKSFLDALRNLDNPNYSIRGNVAEYARDVVCIEYEQQSRRSGRTKHSLFSLMNLAITNFVDYTDILLKASIVIGGIGSLVCVICALVFFIMKLLNWSQYAMGIAPLLIGIFFVGAINMFLLGIIGEYILSVRRQVKKAPLVIEDKRINFV